MKNKITKKLMLTFSTMLVLFSIVIGSIFFYMFSNLIENMYKNTLFSKANIIALNLTKKSSHKIKESQNNKSLSKKTFFDNFSKSHDIIVNNKKKQSDYNLYWDILKDTFSYKVWIIDTSKNIVDINNININPTMDTLPTSTKNIIEAVLVGEKTSSLDAKIFNKNSTISVGIPLLDTNKNVIGGVFLSAKTNDFSETLSNSFTIFLISTLIALIFGLVFSIILSKKFTKPLKTMEKTTRELANGNYNANTNITQNDEIGSLAKHIDILSLKLNEAAKESEKLEKMRQDYISNISHELRTPVTVIRGSLEALYDGIITSKEQINEFHEEMLKESIHLERMVNDLLELSRLQNLDYSIDKSTINLFDILSDSVRVSKKIALNKNIQINYNLPSSTYSIEGDYGRLRQMFLTILDNAVKFSNNNSSIDIEIVFDKNSPTIKITDYGCGISKKDQPYIFDRFYKTSDEKNSNGTGLGLAIAKQIADRHNIKLSVISEQNNFSTFIFKF